MWIEIINWLFGKPKVEKRLLNIPRNPKMGEFLRPLKKKVKQIEDWEISQD